MQSGLVSHIQKYSLEDGPGIRTTVFLKGCPLNCWWCHNPENRSTRPELVVMEARCIRCGECGRACPDPLAAGGEAPWKGSADCDLCGSCVEACPTGGRRRVGRQMAVDEVLATVRQDILFYEDSGGGVTFSGGEPLMQPAFLLGLLEGCRRHGVHTAVDTCGYATREIVEAAAPLAGLFLYDLKFMSEAQHIRYTGVTNAGILENLELLGRIHNNIWIRVPVIPGVNDGEDQLETMARFVASMPGVRQVNLLPYHATGKAKFRRLGRPYRLEEVQPPSAAQLEEAVRRFRAHGLNTKAGG